MKNIIWICLSLGILTAGCSASSYFSKGDKAYGEMRYSVAIEHYEKGLEKKRNPHIVEKLAHSYRKVNDVEHAEPLYLEASLNPDVEPNVLFHLGNMHMGQSRTAEAIKTFSMYLEKKPDDPVAQMLLASCWSINDRYRDTTLYELKRIPLDQFENTFSATEYREGIVFTADKEVFSGSKKAGWTGNSYLDLYYMEKGDSGKWLNPSLLEGNVNGRFHEGSASFNKAGDEVYFTRSNYYKRRMIKNDSNENNLKIFKSTLVDGKWKQLEELPFNSDDYSCGHPALSKNGKTLFFISDMPGGQGGTDIYQSKLVDGKWTEPENLGDIINTPGNEMFPYMHGDGTLYFSSNAHNTMGGLDVFMTFHYFGRWMEPENLNYPLNTTKDDYGFSLLDNDTTGFVSSSRVEGDNIYEFTKKAPTFNLFGTARMKGTDIRVEGVTVSIMQERSKKTYEMVSDKNGEFQLKLDPEDFYHLACTKMGCFTRTDLISTIGLKYSKNFYADFEVEEIELDKPIVLENIYYDFDKWFIRADAATELNQLAKLLIDNPNIHIEMGSHTDARGTDAYNLVLSDKRAAAAVQYLIFKGVEKERLTWKGYGELVPVNKCVNKIECDEELHQDNRRTEFKVTKK